MATKLPLWLVEKADDCDRLLDEQLSKLEMDQIDVYLLHALNRQRWPMIAEMDILRFLDRIVEDGRVRYVGFSFHDDIRLFKEIVDSYTWDVAQIQLNYLDRQYQAGLDGMRYAAERGLGVVAMEPLRGGKLTDSVPTRISKIWDEADQRRTPAEWALRWVWDHAEVATVLSGMSSLDQLRENILLADGVEAGCLTADDMARIDRVTEIYLETQKVPCTSCAYCLPCPHGVNIPFNFSLYNDTYMFADDSMSFRLYNQLLTPEQRASGCQECGECLQHCPQKIAIIEELRKVDDKLGVGSGE